MIQGHIKNLLYAYDCVIIPDFGGLITHYKPASIHPVKHTFSPPSKRVAFNEQLKVNDGLLISTLAKKQQWPLTQAQQAVAEFVQELKEQLLVQHRFELQDIGVFRYNAERKIVFENIESENFLEASFGLPELVSKPIIGKEQLVLRGKYKDQTAGQPGDSKKVVGRFRKLFRIGASLVVGGLTVSAVCFFSVQKDVALSSLNPISLLSGQEAPETKKPAAGTAQPEILESNYPVSEATGNVLGQEGTTVVEEPAQVDSVWGSFEKNMPKTASEEIAVLPKDEKALAVVSKTKEKEISEPALAVKPEATKPFAKETVLSKGTATTINKKTGRFYVIMGVFTQDGYAKRNQKQLKKKGYAAKIVQPAYDQKRERVSVADFSTEAEAYAALPALRKKINNELWVFNY